MEAVPYTPILKQKIASEEQIPPYLRLDYFSLEIDSNAMVSIPIKGSLKYLELTGGKAKIHVPLINLDIERIVQEYTQMLGFIEPEKVEISNPPTEPVEIRVRGMNKDDTYELLTKESEIKPEGRPKETTQDESQNKSLDPKTKLEVQKFRERLMSSALSIINDLLIELYNIDEKFRYEVDPAVVFFDSDKTLFNMITDSDLKVQLIMLMLLKNKSKPLQNLDLQRLVVNGLDWSGVRFDGINLSGSLITNTNLSKTSLTGCDLRRCDLSNCNVQNVSFRGSNINKAQLIYACYHNENGDYSQSTIVFVDLSECILTQAKLPYTLINCNLSSSRLNGIHIPDRRLLYCDFHNCNLPKSNLSRAKLDTCNLTNVSLNNADLTNSRFIDCDLINANLQGADLSHAIFIDCDLINANLQGANLTNTTFYNCKINHVDLKKINISQTLFLNSPFNE